MKEEEEEGPRWDNPLREEEEERKPKLEDMKDEADVKPMLKTKEKKKKNAKKVWQEVKMDEERTVVVRREGGEEQVELGGSLADRVKRRRS